MQSLKDIIGSKNFDEPPEIIKIKSFIKEMLDIEVSVNIQKFSISIIASSASQAGAIQQILHILKAEVGSDKKIFIRIG